MLYVRTNNDFQTTKAEKNLNSGFLDFVGRYLSDTNVTLVFCFPELPHFITKPPPSVTIREKQNMTLHCKAAGFPPPIITWYKDGQVIEEEKKQFKKRKLEINGIQFEHRGIYTCTAENLLGRVQGSVNVTVKGK